MKVVFADTFYWAALTRTDDPAHTRALEISRTLSPNKIVTTDEVLCEYLAFFAGARPSVRDQAGKNVTGLMTDPTVSVAPQSRGSFLSGLELYRARPDKGYSLVDCISMQTMRREGITEVLTNDRHFRAGRFPGAFPGLVKGTGLNKEHRVEPGVRYRLFGSTFVSAGTT